MVPATAPEISKPHVYAVTSLHVIQRGASTIRLNKIKHVPYPEGGGLTTIEFRFLEYEPYEWEFTADGDDIAVLDVTESIPLADDFVRGVPETDLASKDWRNSVSLTVGEDVFMVGLFTGNPGTAYNHAAVRFGNISQLSEMRHPVEQGHCLKRPSHVIDMHSRPGFSGSPVFVYRTPGNDLTAIDEQGTFTADWNAQHTAFVKLLGIHSGQFPEITRDGIEVQSSMTVVVPADAISQLLHSEALVKKREQREADWLSNNGPSVIPDAAEAETESDGPFDPSEIGRKTVKITGA